MEELGGPFIEALKTGGPFGVGLGVGLTLYFLERAERIRERERFETAAKEGSNAMQETAEALRELNRILLSPRRRNG